MSCVCKTAGWVDKFDRFDESCLESLVGLFLCGIQTVFPEKIARLMLGGFKSKWTSSSK